jgi:hypothetical protein
MAKRIICPSTCDCICHDSGGASYGSHSPDGTGVCPGKLELIKENGNALDSL